jgi:hypothetical protein
MTLDQVTAQLAAIRHLDSQGKHPDAHADEDSLLWDFVEHVENTGSDELRKMASAMLEQVEQRGYRWFE